MFPMRENTYYNNQVQKTRGRLGTRLGLVMMSKAITLAARGLQEVAFPPVSQTRSLKDSSLQMHLWLFSSAMDAALRFY